MQQRLILFVLFLNYHLLIKSQQTTNSNGKIELEFVYSSKHSSIKKPIRVTTYLVPKTAADSYYILTDVEINDKTRIIRAIDCMKLASREHCGNCGTRSRSSYFLLANRMSSGDSVLRIENKDCNFKQLLYNLSIVKSFNASDFNLTCIFPNSAVTNFHKPNDPYGYPLSETSLFGIIFLSICVVLVFGLCIGWFAIMYYRRCTQYRMKKKLQQELAQSTQQMLDKSPVVIFDSNNKDNEHIDDDDPICAICLEPFKNKEKIRKLICLHYFHMTCIDPWLLSHQSCPLCNRNILRNSIPSISSSIMAAINEQNNDESITIGNDDENRTSQAQNSNL